MVDTPIKVLIVDDSRTEQLVLTNILTSDPGIKVIGTADDGPDAIKFVKKHKPDIITMDLNMPGMDGLSVTRAIMETEPVPIIIVTGDRFIGTASSAFKLMEAGAVAIVEKPAGINDIDHDAMSRQLRRLIRNLANVRLVHRWPRKTSERFVERRIMPGARSVACVGIGASTGGPMVIKHILDNLPAKLPLPIFIVQHISPGFTKGFVHWLQRDVKHELRIPSSGEAVNPGCIYVAPDGTHMGVRHGQIVLSDTDPKEHGLRPSVSYLFRSLDDEYGHKTVAILLTGMGVDGARELKLLRDRGAITIAQNEDTSTVYGMPGEAIKLDAATHEMSPSQIVEYLGQLFVDL